MSDLWNSINPSKADHVLGVVGGTLDEIMATSKHRLVVTPMHEKIINAIIEHQLRKAQSAGQSSWHLGTTIAPIAKKLASSLEKIYREKSLIFNINIAAQCNFKGDEADLLEILGNLFYLICFFVPAIYLLPLIYRDTM